MILDMTQGVEHLQLLFNLMKSNSFWGQMLRI